MSIDSRNLFLDKCAKFILPLAGLPEHPVESASVNDIILNGHVPVIELGYGYTKDVDLPGIVEKYPEIKHRNYNRLVRSSTNAFNGSVHGAYLGLLSGMGLGGGLGGPIGALAGAVAGPVLGGLASGYAGSRVDKPGRSFPAASMALGGSLGALAGGGLGSYLSGQDQQKTLLGAGIGTLGGAAGGYLLGKALDAD